MSTPKTELYLFHVRDDQRKWWLLTDLRDPARRATASTRSKVCRAWELRHNAGQVLTAELFQVTHYRGYSRPSEVAATLALLKRDG